MIWAFLPGSHEPRCALGIFLLPWCRRKLLAGPNRFGRRLGPDVCGDAQGERGPGAWPAPEADRAAVVVRHVLDDRQAEAGAAGRARAGLVCAGEAREHPRLLVLGDADAAVGHRGLARAAGDAAADRGRAARGPGRAGALEE